MIDYLKTTNKRDLEKVAYEQVRQELGDDNLDEALWLKAETASQGDEKKIKSIYVKYRVKEVMDAIRLENKRTNKTPSVGYRIIEFFKVVLTIAAGFMVISLLISFLIFIFY